MVKLYIMSNDRPTLDGIIDVEPSYMDNDRVHQQFPKIKKKQELFPNVPQFIDITTTL